MSILIFITIVALAITVHVEIESLKQKIDEERISREFNEKGDY